MPLTPARLLPQPSFTAPKSPISPSSRSDTAHPPLPGPTPTPPSIPAQPRPVPLVPEDVLKRHDAFVATDNRFTAACRLLAALWAAERGLPAGRHQPGDRPRVGTTSSSVRLGSRLSAAAARAGATFLSPAIAAHVREVLLFREPGALFEETRLWGNLLSSQALTLNLFVPLALDLNLATAVFRRLLPGFVGTVVGIRFEHSPGRRGLDYFGDGTAFDALIDIVTPDGEPAFVAIEVKYTEGAGGPAPTPRLRYAEATQVSGLYRDPDAELLARPGFEQLRREHVMAQIMLQHGLYGRGYFILLGPAQNRYVQAMGRLYTAELIDPTEAPGRIGFHSLTLEAVIAAIAKAGAGEHAAAFASRYLHLDRVARHILSQPSPALPAPRRPTSKPASAAEPDKVNPGQLPALASSGRAKTKVSVAAKAAQDLTSKPKKSSGMDRAQPTA